MDIMRGRKRSGPSPLARVKSIARVQPAGTNSDADVQIDGALRALARLLARQAARDVFERMSTDAPSASSVDEGRE